MVVHFKKYCNTYGSVASYVIGFIFRVAGGEPLIGLEPFIYFPGWNGEEQLFPFRTLAMVLSLISVVAFSLLTQYIFESGKLPPSWDVLRCVVNIPEDVVRVEEPQEGEMAVMTGLTQVRKYSATDEMNGCVNPALSLGSDSDEDVEAHRQRNKRDNNISGVDSPSKRPMLNDPKKSAAKNSPAPLSPPVGKSAEKQTTF